VFPTLFSVYGSDEARLRQEIEVAQRLQNSLIPTEMPASEDFRIYGTNVPARDVSGDFFDFIEVDEHHLLVVVADASGKGIPACMLTALTRSFLRVNAKRFKEDLEGLLMELNTNIHEDTEGAQFITMACCLIDRRDCTVEYARAGHTELLIHGPTDGLRVISPDGPALGLLPNDFDVHFDTFTFTWLPGTSILMFTDGITEAMNDEEQQYGLQNLIESWDKQQPDPAIVVKEILAGVDAFAQDRPQDDDQTLVLLTRPPVGVTEMPAPTSG